MHRIMRCCFAFKLLTEEVERELREEAAEVLAGGTEDMNSVTIESLVPEASLPLIHARLTNHAKLTPLKNLKASYYGEF